MKILERPGPLKVINPFADRIYKCSCGIKFMVEEEDMADIFSKSIMYVEPNWYEMNMPRNMRIHYICCECGREVPLETYERGYYSFEGAKQLGGQPFRG